MFVLCECACECACGQVAVRVHVRVRAWESARARTCCQRCVPVFVLCKYACGKACGLAHAEQRRVLIPHGVERHHVARGCVGERKRVGGGWDRWLMLFAKMAVICALWKARHRRCTPRPCWMGPVGWGPIRRFIFQILLWSAFRLWFETTTEKEGLGGFLVIG